MNTHYFLLIFLRKLCVWSIPGCLCGPDRKKGRWVTDSHNRKKGRTGLCVYNHECVRNQIKCSFYHQHELELFHHCSFFSYSLLLSSSGYVRATENPGVVPKPKTETEFGLSRSYRESLSDPSALAFRFIVWLYSLRKARSPTYWRLFSPK